MGPDSNFILCRSLCPFNSGIFSVASLISHSLFNSPFALLLDLRSAYQQLGMAPHIEASSLSDITQLASNPPKYPRNPTEKKRQPLTLYIARVPGSRDIILTTLKPQLKNVTAEDVASSLYYFHLNSDDDADLLADDSGVIVEEEEPAEIKQKPLPRKPLPESARSSIDLNSQSKNVPEPPSTLNSTPDINRKALPLDAQTSTQSHVHAKDQVQRKPLGPRPFLSNPSTRRHQVGGVENRLLSLGTQTQNTGSGPYISTRTEDSGHTIQNYNAVTSSVGLKKSFSITIIRRDPSSGAQWNVGAVLGQEQSGSSESKKPYFDISVHLTTPGYTQFREPQTDSWNAESGNTSLANGSVMSDAPHMNVQSVFERGFDRQLRMEGTSIWDRSKQHKRSQSNTSGGFDNSRENSDSAGGKSDKIYSHSNDAGSKGYAFSSPWGGRCKFSTSSSGRTLRCKHTLPDPVSARNSIESGSSSQPVSELRFNLPSLAMFHTHSPISPKDHINGSGRFQLPKLDHIRNKLSPDKILHPSLPPRPHPTSYASMYPSDEEDRPQLPPRPFSNSYETESSDEDLEEDRPVPNRFNPFPHGVKSTSDGGGRLDLSIGREKAGGGNRGKRVKLGKLIIIDEGFKMLDLVVASNMGIWWSVWESSN